MLPISFNLKTKEDAFHGLRYFICSRAELFFGDNLSLHKIGKNPPSHPLILVRTIEINYEPYSPTFCRSPPRPVYSVKQPLKIDEYLIKKNLLLKAAHSS